MEQFDDNCDKLTLENNTYGRTLGSSLDKVAAFALANREIALSNRELAMGNRVAVAELRKESKSEMTYRDMAEEMVKKGIASGAYKVNFPFWTNIMNGLTAGAYISLGAYLSAFVGAGMPTISQGNPGLVAVRYLSPTSPVSRYRQLILSDHALCALRYARTVGCRIRTRGD